MINEIINKVLLQLYPSKVGKNLRIRGKIYRRGKGKLIIGDDVTINSSMHSNILGGKDYTTIYVKTGSEVVIGNHVGISNTTIICFEGIIIGNNTLIGADSKIYDTDFHSLEYDLRGTAKQDIPKCEPISISDNVFIGAHSIILKGVSIGKNSIIGAGSVVTKNIPAEEIWAGNPAIFIRKI